MATPGRPENPNLGPLAGRLCAPGLFGGVGISSAAEVSCGSADAGCGSVGGARAAGENEISGAGAGPRGTAAGSTGERADGGAGSRGAAVVSTGARGGVSGGSSGGSRGVADRWPIAKVLDREPYRFEFFQAVRLLELMYADREVVGRFTNPRDEVVRFGAASSIAFPASEIQSLDRSETPPLMRVNFMGLTGPQGVLPLDYSALVSERLRARDTAMRDFFDLFNHRMISLFYQAWEKYRFSIPYERGERDRFSHHVLALLGLATPGLQDRQDAPDDALLFYSGLLAAHARSATGLRQLLSDYFGVEVEIEQFVGAWYPMEREAQCCLGEGPSESGQLGVGAVVGDEIYDRQSRVRHAVRSADSGAVQRFLAGRRGLPASAVAGVVLRGRGVSIWNCSSFCEGMRCRRANWPARRFRPEARVDDLGEIGGSRQGSRRDLFFEL